MNQFNDWKERAGTAYEKWAADYWSELETHIRQRLVDGEISDDAFVAVINVCMPAGYSDTERFARDTSLHQNELSNWIRGQELPLSDVRAAYVHICLSVAGRVSTADRVVKLLTSKALLPDVLFGSSVSHSEVSPDSRLLDVFSTEVTELHLSVRAENCLKNECIEYVGQLVNYTETQLLRIPMLGKVSLNEIKEILSSMGVRLGMSTEHYEELDLFLKQHPLHFSPDQR